MRNEASLAVLGFRPHTYWTAVVALAGSVQAPLVIERRRIVFAVGDERLVYHNAADAASAESAATYIARTRAATEANAAREIEAFIADLRRADVSVRIAATSASTTKVPDSLHDIVRSHARIHAAEGNFYRDVVAAACGALGLDVRREVERELPNLMCDLLAVDPAALDLRLRNMGATLGPPWSVDQKLATEAAWLHLDEAR